MTRAGLPHSEIPGSKCVCHSPRLIAAYHVLHRLPVPRHPPYTLSNLTENPWVARSTLSAYKHRHEVHALSRISRHFQYEVVNERITSRPSSGQRILYIMRGPSSGDDRDRTGDLWLAKPSLSQLSYVPVMCLSSSSLPTLAHHCEWWA